MAEFWVMGEIGFDDRQEFRHTAGDLSQFLEGRCSPFSAVEVLAVNNDGVEQAKHAVGFEWNEPTQEPGIDGKIFLQKLLGQIRAAARSH